MQAFLELLLLVGSMAVGTYLFGLVPLMVPLSRKNLRFVELLGAGLLLGSCLTLVIPEGVGTVIRASVELEQANRQRERNNATSLLPDLDEQMTAEKSGNHWKRHGHADSEKDLGRQIRDVLNGGETIIGLVLLAGFFLMFLLEQTSSKATPEDDRHHHHPHSHSHESTRWQYEALATGDQTAENGGNGLLPPRNAPVSGGDPSSIERRNSQTDSVRMHRQSSARQSLYGGVGENVQGTSPPRRESSRHRSTSSSISSGECNSLLDEDLDSPSGKGGADVSNGGTLPEYTSRRNSLRQQRSSMFNDSDAGASPSQRNPRRGPLDHRTSALLGHSRRQPSMLFAPRPDASASGLKAALASIVGLMIHAVADGIAMGASVVSNNSSLTWIVFAAIMIHKAPSSFGLCSVLLARGIDRKAIRRAVGIFALCTPFGATLSESLVPSFEYQSLTRHCLFCAAYLLLKLAFSVTQAMQSAHVVGAHINKDAAAAPDYSQIYIGSALTFSGGTFLFVAMHALEDVTDSSGPDAGEGMQQTHSHRQQSSALPATVEEEEGEPLASNQGHNLPSHSHTHAQGQDWVGKPMRISVIVIGALIPKFLQIITGGGGH